MVNVKSGQVKKIVRKRQGLTEVLVDVDNREMPAVNYDALTGDVEEGDLVFVNTSAMELGLGTGGFHFVMGVMFRERLPLSREDGHIMRLRYTPYQFPVKCVEENETYRERMEAFTTLSEMPVILCALHSQLAPAACALKKLSGAAAKIAVIITDGAALPSVLSNLLVQLKEKKVVSHVITCGQSFGGDYEAVNIYGAMIFAKQILSVDAVLISQGPGSVGTETRYGFSGVEVGGLVNAVNVLGGTAIVVPRISFADARERHRGLSHHTKTVLKDIALTPALVPVPDMAEERLNQVLQQLKDEKIEAKHTVLRVSGNEGLEAMSEFGLDVKTMGRSVDEDAEFFLAASAAGTLAWDMIKEKGTVDREQGAGE